MPIKEKNIIFVAMLSFSLVLPTIAGAQNSSGLITRNRGNSLSPIPQRPFPIRPVETLSSPQSIPALRAAIQANKGLQAQQAQAGYFAPRMAQLESEGDRLQNELEQASRRTYSSKPQTSYPLGGVDQNSVGNISDTNYGARSSNIAPFPAQPYVKKPGAQTYKQYLESEEVWKPASTKSTPPLNSGLGIDPHSDPRRVYRPR